jgi:hypothetical protein
MHKLLWRRIRKLRNALKLSGQIQRHVCQVCLLLHFVLKLPHLVLENINLVSELNILLDCLVFPGILDKLFHNLWRWFSYVFFNNLNFPFLGVLELLQLFLEHFNHIQVLHDFLFELEIEVVQQFVFFVLCVLVELIKLFQNQILLS